MPPARKALLPPSHPTSRGSFRRRYPPYWSDSRPRRLPPIPAHLPGERRQLPFPWPSLTIPATCHFNLFLNRRFKDKGQVLRCRAMSERARLPEPSKSFCVGLRRSEPKLIGSTKIVVGIG